MKKKEQKRYAKYDVYFGNHFLGSTMAKSPRQASNNINFRCHKQYSLNTLSAFKKEED